MFCLLWSTMLKVDVGGFAKQGIKKYSPNEYPYHDVFINANNLNGFMFHFVVMEVASSPKRVNSRRLYFV
jgi:hypothetical protein